MSEKPGAFQFFRDDGSELTYGVILFVLYLVAAMLGRRLFDELEE